MIFILCLVLAKLVTRHQIAGKQQFRYYRPLPGLPVLLPKHFIVQRLSIKMIVTPVDLFEDGRSVQGFCEVHAVPYGQQRCFHFVYQSGFCLCLLLACSCFDPRYTGDLLQAADAMDQVFQLVGILDIHHEGALKDTFFGADGRVLHVEFHLAADHIGDFIDKPHIVPPVILSPVRNAISCCLVHLVLTAR